MKEKRPSMEEWQKLYNVAIEFEKLKCWNWMYDDNLFGVRNPENGEIGYCCIMGNLGEMFAIAVYLGSEGLDGYLKILSGEIGETGLDAAYCQKCLMASFEDRDYLQKEDLQLIKKLGLKFRGRKQWPMFRSYRPGYFPWFLTKEEALFLTTAIEQSIDVALRFRENEDLLISHDEDEYLIRVPDKTEDIILWEDRWMRPAPMEKNRMFDDRVDEIRIQKIKKKATRTDAIWEIEMAFSPTPVREKKERPYFPRMIAVIDQRSMMALDFYMFEISSDTSELRNHFLSFLEKYGILPQEILIRKDETLQIIEPITSLLKIHVELVPKLLAFEEFYHSMFDFFQTEKG
ncbi:MAG: hypothetical protein L6244_05195 [Candidatus Methanoperedenaceae archaeon]|nr:hypothetical protein [Candidatus Methanoperedenaceae archaeon]